MLAARKMDEAILEPIPEQPQQEAPYRRPKAKVKPRFLKFLYISAVMCSFCCGLYFCSLALGVANRGYEINRLKEEIKALEIANERLRLEIAHLDSLERVEMLAYNELGMIKPGEADYLLIPGMGDSILQQNQEAEFKVANVEENAPSSVAPNQEELPLFQQKVAGILSVAVKKE